MQEQILSPYAASLSQSMRDIGYSLETAIADLIDNSITADAKHIRIFLDLTHIDQASLAIIDDGSGMSEDELIEAMRLGSRDPREQRDANDLGRFGLGLKTASFSQCKSLTVVTRKHGNVFAAQWDLDLINSRNEWIVNRPSLVEIEKLPFFNELHKEGTYVLWQKLDRLIENNTNERGKIDAYNKLDIVERHLALVFHRYISGDIRKQKVSIEINGHKVEAFDPFCVSNKATQMLQEEIVRIDGHEVKIQPYILPHHSKLSKTEYDYYRSRSDFVTNQGAYVYRNGRLMAWADWFRLVPKSEATKLARVKIDFPNSLDEHWTIDIKKSRAHPPYQVKEKLRQIINRVTDHSKRVHVGRGDRLFIDQEQPLWVRYSDRTGIRYAINRDNPLIRTIEDKLELEVRGVFEDILMVLERSMPLEAIYADYSSSPQLFEEKTTITPDELKDKLLNLFMLVSASGMQTKESFARMIYGLKPFSENRDAVQRILEELV